MTITQTVEISDSRRLHLDLEVPREIPVGRTDVIIQFPVREDIIPEKPATAKTPEIRVSRKELDDMVKKSTVLKELTGILSELKDADLDEIRYKALAEKHLK